MVIHVQLVLAAKSGKCHWDAQAIEAGRQIFRKVCRDFESQLVRMDAEGDHVYLLVNYPPKGSVSSPVKSRKGALF